MEKENERIYNRPIQTKGSVTKLNNVVAIDIGSRTGKAVLLGEGNIYTAQIGTGFDMQETANELLKQLFEQFGYIMEDIEYIVGTGYGRVSMDFPQVPKKIVSEISAHAMGVHFLDADVRTIIDIGGQDSKAIKVDPMTGKVVDFIMNDKCAAGTGRFLEKVATILGFTVETIGEEALKSDKDVEISSQCVVFAESEIVSLRASGETAQDIAAGVHYAAAKRVYTLVKRVELEPELQFSGGVANNVGMRHALEKVIGHPIKETKLNMIYAGYYKYYTGGNYWTNPVNYDITLNSDRMGIENCVEMIKQGVEIKLGMELNQK